MRFSLISILALLVVSLPVLSSRATATTPLSPNVNVFIPEPTAPPVITNSSGTR
jgi:hypothetical protein